MRKKLSEQYLLTRHAERLEMALLGSNAALWDWNILTGEVYFSDEVYTMLGYGIGEFSPQLDAWFEMVHPDDSDRVKNALEAHLAGETPFYQTEHRLRKKDGQWMWVLDTGKVLEWNEAGKPARAVGTHLDIDQKKQIEFDLQHSLDQHELLSDIALSLNALEEFSVQINHVLEKIGNHTGVSRVYIFEDSADGKTTDNTYEWCNEDISPQIDELQGIPYEMIPSWKKLLVGEGRVYSENIRELPGDLQAILEPQGIRSIIIYPLHVQGSFFGFIGFDECVRNKKWSRSELELLRTVSGILANAYERKRMEQSLKSERDRANEANRAKSRFLANMSHEIRTPMNAVLGFSEALAVELRSAKQQKMVRSILSSGNLLLSLLNDILDLSKIEAGKMAIEPKPTLLKSMLEDIRVLFGGKAKTRGVGLTVFVDEQVPDVVVLDEVRIKQVIFNLLGNAIKFTREGEVRVEVFYHHASESAGELQIAVRDTGIGIPEKDLEMIFEPFMQQSDQSTRDYEGAGLGLSICKRLIEQIDGTLEVESSVGVGSLFTVKIPAVERGVAADVAGAADGLPAIDSDYKFDGGVVLMVDDVSSNLDATEALLDGSGLELVRAGSGEMAIRLLQNMTPDVLLLDIRMPGMDGYDVAQCVRGVPELKKMKIIAFTALVIGADKPNDPELFDAVLFKPVRRKELLGVLGKFLPYTISEGATEDGAEVLMTKVPEETMRRLPELISALEGPVADLWKEINGSLVLFRIEAFAGELERLQDDFEIPVLGHYVAQLKEGLELVDLEKIIATVGGFPGMIEKIKQIVTTK